ncbi:HNH endonuclease signature motif containing protein [Promicromonospora soli]|uniref:HNH nuclease domain-containing protein n=1 Tax=Promicromonospora soli TaxID=2035533 RepID=A0A919FWL8_9MICO|nr:HNH endonuclease signature motif containing protein [Promicromonospora soli]GHH73141.1 hypothetical protein GCM10017772_23830 [Promicromonospora soli]
MGEGRSNDGVGGALRNDMFVGGAVMADVVVDEDVPGEVVVDGVLVRRVPDGVLPPGEPFEDATFDDAWFEGAWFEGVVRAGEPDVSARLDSVPSAGLDWPPDTVPVVLWPVEVLRAALSNAPGAGLARVVAEVTDPDIGVLADLPDDALGDLVAACGRLQSWSAGVQAGVVAERAARENSPLAHSSLVGQVTSELMVTETEGTEVVVRAESGVQHPTVIGALLAGRIDMRKAQTLLRSASQLTIAERTEAIAKFLPHAPRRTWKWLQARMLAFAKARHGAAEAARAEAQRRAVHLDRAENDMGWLSAYLPATDAAAVWGVVDDMAHQLRHVTGEDRTLAQLRADSLTGIITGRLLPADRFTDTDTDPDSPTAGGDTARSDGACDDTSTGAPACTCGGKAPVQQVVQEVSQVVRVTPTRPVVRVTIPASALLGVDDAPGDLAGFGPIPAETARMIAQDATWQRLVTDPVTGVLTDYSTTTYKPGKVLRAAVEARDDTCTFLTCDTPATHCDLDHIVSFDHDLNPATVLPGTPGQTRAANLQPLCRRHHLLKTHGGWGVVRDPYTGITTWTTPTGRVHTGPPTVLDTHVQLDQVDQDTSYDLTLHALTGQHLPRQYATAEPGAAPIDPASPTDSDEPPF